MAELLSMVGDLAITDGNNDDLPPSYSESTTSSIPRPNFRSSNPNSSTTRLPPSLTSHFTSPIAAHLSSLPSRLRSAQQAHANSQAAADLETITVLAPAIEDFLHDLGSDPSRAPPPRAELTLVPASAVPRGWALSGAAERRREGEVVRVVRVEGISPPDAKGKGDSKGSDKKGKGEKASSSSWNPAVNDDDDDEGFTYTGARGEGFDEWGRFNDGEDDGLSEVGAGTYFRDERMARRLSGYLQPKAEVFVERKQIQQAVVDAKKEKGFRWGRKKSESSSPVASPSQAQVPVVKTEQGSPGGPGPIVQGDDRVSMVVRADEVTFRKENDFGVWESRTGFGIVVRIRVKKP
ncbi:hypothetical protein QBC34DRAFT_411362 [Podospora aff. communis PSN243]|uniref:Uncharacterized protein n=1 Tax=Podospora aff. communis PSN243 TaxID=3040156 RepID=A0AAV9GEL3_9PEZI|nr:hypothetical protein QBC34DRAFT_411362 [Podospora aff. communis PSN243]